MSTSTGSAAGSRKIVPLWQMTTRVESGNVWTAIRFEPTDYMSPPAWIRAQVGRIQGAHGGGGQCSEATALMIAATSWGAYQVLGANIWSSGYDKPVGAFLSDLPGQTSVFKNMCGQVYVWNEDVTAWSDERFAGWAAHYNGPGNVAAYVAACHAAVSALLA
jgi:hypothetical protein